MKNNIIKNTKILTCVLVLFLLTISIPLYAYSENYTATYTYDKLDRLTKTDYGDGSYIEYQHDAAGNIITKNVVTPLTSPVLLYPVDSQTGLDPTLTFKWKKATDSAGNPLTYYLYYCENNNFSGCEPTTVASLKNQKVFYASLGSGAGLLLGTLFLMGGIENKKKFGLLMAMLLATSTILASCGSGGSGSEEKLNQIASIIDTDSTGDDGKDESNLTGSNTDNTGGGSGDTNPTEGNTDSNAGGGDESNLTGNTTGSNTGGSGGDTNPAGGNTDNGSGNEMTQKVTLEPAKTYFWKVVVKNDKGSMAETNVWKLTTK